LSSRWRRSCALKQDSQAREFVGALKAVGFDDPELTLHSSRLAVA